MMLWPCLIRWKTTRSLSVDLTEFAEGLCGYFDSFARARLLYNTAETKQYDRLRKQSA
jgi:hypothetical protein